MNNVQELLSKEIKSEFEGLEDIEIGTDEYKTTVDGLTKLVDRTIELEKIQKEHERQVQQLAEEKKDHFVKNCITAGTAVLGIGLTVWGTIYSTNFEKEDSVTTTAGREFFRKLLLLPKK